VTETIDRCLRNKRLLGAALGDAGSWSTWLAVLRASFGLPLDVNQRQLFAAVSGGRAPPTKRVRELWALIGRKGGKSRMAAAIAVYCALFLKYRLSRGERGMVLVLAMSMDQAKVVFDYCIGFLSSSDVLRQEIVSTTAHEIRLRNGAANHQSG
jgi:phage terminase large subunit-like protein